MKLVTIALALILSAGAVMAAESPDCHWLQKKAWRLVDGCWVLMPMNDRAARARAWSYVIDYKDSCNKQVWNLTLKHEASVAQWMIIWMNADGFHWAVRKPGCYITDCVEFGFRSNYDVAVTFSGFDNLRPLDPNKTIDQEIEVEYALSDDGDVPPDPNSNLWTTAANLNDLVINVQDSEELHYNGWKKHIWAKICVSPCNGPTDYVDPNWATITATLQCMRPWIDPGTGLFKVGDAGMPAFPFQ